MTCHASEPALDDGRSRAPRRVFLLCAILLVTLPGCSSWFKKSEDKNPLTKTECPVELPALTDPSMGAQGKLMIEWAGIYHACRKAGTAGDNK